MGSKCVARRRFNVSTQGLQAWIWLKKQVETKIKSDPPVWEGTRLAGILDANLFMDLAYPRGNDRPHVSLCLTFVTSLRIHLLLSGSKHNDDIRSRIMNWMVAVEVRPIPTGTNH